MKKVLFRHKFIAFSVQHPIYHRHCVALQHCQYHETEFFIYKPIKDILELGHCILQWLAFCGDAWGSAALRCLVGLTVQNFVLFHVTNMSIVAWLNHQLISALKWWLEILSCVHLAWYLLLCRSVAELSRIEMVKSNILVRVQRHSSRQGEGHCSRHGEGGSSHRWRNEAILIATLTLVFVMRISFWNIRICWTLLAAASLCGSSMVPESGLLGGSYCLRPSATHHE